MIIPENLEVLAEYIQMYSFLQLTGVAIVPLLNHQCLKSRQLIQSIRL